MFRRLWGHFTDPMSESDDRSKTWRVWDRLIRPVITFFWYTLGVLIMILFAYLFIMDWWEDSHKEQEPIPVWKLEQDFDGYPERGWP